MKPYWRSGAPLGCREAFRTLHPRGGRKPMRAFSFLEVEGEEEPGETVDLATLAKGERNEP